MPGAEAHYYKRASVGLTFYVVLDARKLPVVTSISAKTGENIGFLVGRAERDDFAKAGAPTITAQDLIVREACVRMIATR